MSERALCFGLVVEFKATVQWMKGEVFDNGPGPVGCLSPKPAAAPERTVSRQSFHFQQLKVIIHSQGWWNAPTSDTGPMFKHICQINNLWGRSLTVQATSHLYITHGRTQNNFHLCFSDLATSLFQLFLFYIFCWSISVHKQTLFQIFNVNFINL